MMAKGKHMSLVDHYILNERGEPEPCDELLVWAQWFEDSAAARRIAFTDLGKLGQVSTVFLGLDQDWHPVPIPLTYRPLLWESMIFGGPFDMEQERYRSREEAERGHQTLVRMCQSAERDRVR
jgi:hypothetical protein